MSSIFRKFLRNRQDHFQFSLLSSFLLGTYSATTRPTHTFRRNLKHWDVRRKKRRETGVSSGRVFAVVDVVAIHCCLCPPWKQKNWKLNNKFSTVWRDSRSHCATNEINFFEQFCFFCPSFTRLRFGCCFVDVALSLSAERVERARRWYWVRVNFPMRGRVSISWIPFAGLRIRGDAGAHTCSRLAYNFGWNENCCARQRDDDVET